MTISNKSAASPVEGITLAAYNAISVSKDDAPQVSTDKLMRDYINDWGKAEGSGRALAISLNKRFHVVGSDLHWTETADEKSLEKQTAFFNRFREIFKVTAEAAGRKTTSASVPIRNLKRYAYEAWFDAAHPDSDTKRGPGSGKRLPLNERAVKDCGALWVAYQRFISAPADADNPVTDEVRRTGELLSEIITLNGGTMGEFLEKAKKPAKGSKVKA